MFCNKLQNIEALFLYFFQFVFHADNQFLNVVIIGFGTHGIDFATDFLGDESEFCLLYTSIIVQRTMDPWLTNQ